MLSETRGAQILALAATTALLATGCAAGAGGGEGEKPADGKTTITWWHNSNNGDGKAYYGKVAADFEAAHEGVDVEVNAMQHEDMLTKLDAAFQSGDAPDVYMERGGGELAAHVAAGLTKDLTEAASEGDRLPRRNAGGWQLEGKTYALPFSLGGAGFWYNKALFKEAGIDKAPQTFSELIDATEKLKKAGNRIRFQLVQATSGLTAHYWYYAAVRECSQQTMGRLHRQPGLQRPVLHQGRRRRGQADQGRAIQPRIPLHPGAVRHAPPPPACWPPARSPWNWPATGSQASCRA